ncbi:MAG: diaminopimelate decarboxylase [bacterium]|nr:MAG: diaminopimelate decarboxylase [bacterium]
MWNLTTNHKNHIEIDSLDAVDLINEYGSPLLVVNRKQLFLDIQNLKKAMSKAPTGSKILFSYKTNCIPGILTEIHHTGIGAEVISPYELWLAEKLGVRGDMTVYNGVNKTEESIVDAINMKILSINIDHLSEVDKIYRLAKKLKKRVSVGIRLGLVTRDQFGLEIESGEAMQACKKILSHNDYLDLTCLHFNVASNAKDALFHKNCTLKALEFMHQVYSQMGTTIPYLDIGGGFGVPTIKTMSRLEFSLYKFFGCLPKPPALGSCQPIHDFLYEIVNCIKIFCSENNLTTPKIIIEPGRFITSKSELLLAKVHTIKTKKDGTRFAISDAGRFSTAYPCDYEYHEVFVANRANEKLHHVYHIMGSICTSADYLLKNRYLTYLRSGDILAVMDAGAYFSSFSSNFSFPRPGIVMVSDAKSNLIRQPETFDHLIAMDVSDCLSNKKGFENQNFLPEVSRN